MLQVIYDATTRLATGELVEIDESRGRVDIRIRESATPAEFTPALNAKLTDFVGHCSWFQIWRGQIISAAHPDSPLTVQYVVDPEVPRRVAVQILEARGRVRLHVSPEVTAEEFVLAVNPPIRRFLAGGQWFQLWHGEIVTMDSPGAAAA